VLPTGFNAYISANSIFLLNPIWFINPKRHETPLVPQWYDLQTIYADKLAAQERSRATNICYMVPHKAKPPK